MGGMITSSTRELTILPKAAPIMMPTAMSMTLPRIANSLNSLSMDPPGSHRRLGRCSCDRRRHVARRHGELDASLRVASIQSLDELVSHGPAVAIVANPEVHGHHHAAVRDRPVDDAGLEIVDGAVRAALHVARHLERERLDPVEIGSGG